MDGSRSLVMVIVCERNIRPSRSEQCKNVSKHWQFRKCPRQVKDHQVADLDITDLAFFGPMILFCAADALRGGKHQRRWHPPPQHSPRWGVAMDGPLTLP